MARPPQLTAGPIPVAALPAATAGPPGTRVVPADRLTVNTQWENTLGEIKSVTDATFEAEVLKSDKPVLVDFWAEWCGPCRQVAPILQEIASEHADKLTIVKINIDENPQTPRDYGVLQIPTMNVYKGGEVVKQIIGAKPKAMLLRELDGVI